MICMNSILSNSITCILIFMTTTTMIINNHGIYVPTNAEFKTFFTLLAQCHLILCNAFLDNNIYRALIIFVSANVQKMGSSTAIFSILRYVPVPSYTLRKPDVAIDILVNKLLHDTGLGQVNHDRIPEVDASSVIGDNVLLGYNKRVHGWHHPDSLFLCKRRQKSRKITVVIT